MHIVSHMDSTASMAGKNWKVGFKEKSGRQTFYCREIRNAECCMQREHDRRSNYNSQQAENQIKAVRQPGLQNMSSTSYYQTCKAL
jgi:hypothetical protein